MNKIATLDKSVIRGLRVDIDAALSAVAAKHGIVFKTGMCRFTSSAATMKLEIATIGQSGEVVDLEMESLKANLRFLGLTEEHLAKPFRIGNKTFKLVGYKHSRYAKPFGLRCIEDGKTYVARETQVKAALGLSNR